MASAYYRTPSRRTFRVSPAKSSAARATAPLRQTALTGETISNILRFADVEEDLGGGRVLNRLSSRRLEDAEVRAVFGPDLARAAEVSVVWDEREGQIARVYDTARLAA